MIRNWPLLFIIIPIIEIYLLIEVGSRIGALWTVMLVILTAVIGVNLLRYQGFSTLRRAQRSMSQGTMPAMEMMEGLFLAVGGALLITPGFLTDTIGFACLFPLSRRALIKMLLAKSSVQMGGFNAYGSHEDTDRQPDQSKTSSGRTIEGEYTRKDE